MALASESYVGNGTNRDFVVPFPYISRNHVTVSVNGTGVPFTWLTAGTIRTDTAPANGATVRVQRTTPSTPLTDFADGDGNYEAALDIAALQPLYRVQELEDFVTEASLGGAAAVASSITFAPAGTIAATNVQAAIVEAMADLRAELAPKDAPALTGDVRVGGTLYRGGNSLTGGVPFQIDSASATGQARFRHSTGLGLLINQGVAAGGVGIINQDNARLILGANNTEVLEVIPDQTINLLGGSGKLRMNGTITRAEVVGGLVTTGTSTFTFPHNAARVPDAVMLFLRCETADLGYAVGDEVALGTFHSAGSHTVASWVSATHVGLSNNGTLPVVTQKSSSAPAVITSGRWRYVWRCLWL
jgi:hypothetical protein